MTKDHRPTRQNRAAAKDLWDFETLILWNNPWLYLPGYRAIVSRGFINREPHDGIVRQLMAIMGVGLTKRVSAVRWGVTVNLLYAWILTIPVSMAIAALVYWIFKLLNFG